MVRVTAVLKEKINVLRITKVAEDSSTVTMKLEGKLASDWVPLLEGECLICLTEKRKVLLDFSEVTFVDGRRSSAQPSSWWTDRFSLPSFPTALGIAQRNKDNKGVIFTPGKETDHVYK